MPPPPRQITPGRHPGQTLLGSHPPWADSPPGRQPPPRADTPVAVTPADDTHPPGMHSCPEIGDANFESAL